MPDGGLATSVDRGIHADFILALDKQVVQLKRSRSSLLNVARIPLEVLGYTFRFNVELKAGGGHFAGFATTDPKSPAAPRSSGVSGITVWKIESDSTLGLDPLPSILCWTEWRTGMVFSTTTCRITWHGIPYERLSQGRRYATPNRHHFRVDPRGRRHSRQRYSSIIWDGVDPPHFRRRRLPTTGVNAFDFF